MFKQQNNVQPTGSYECPDCKSTRFRISGSKIECTNCDYVLKTKSGNKFGAKKSEFNGKRYDSKFESTVAQSLEIRKMGKDIKDYDIQYMTETWCYKENGTKAFKVKHKVDFRIHHNDGSFELYEAKGIETDDYKWRRKFLENIWLPEHPDHTYTVVKQNSKWGRR